MVHVQSCCFADKTYCFFDVLVTVHEVSGKIVAITFPSCTLFFIRTSIFRVEPGPFLFSGQFQPGNVLKFQ